MKRISEQDEMLLGRLLDDDLSAVEAEALRERLRREPDLRMAYQALARLHELLVERRKDRCAADLHSFHEEVMRRVQSESVSKVIRFPIWLRVAVPIAAAAAIALVVVLRNPVQTLSPQPASSGTLTVAYLTPATAHAASAGALTVLYQRPSGSGQAGDSEALHVAYAQSDELERHYRQLDEARTDQPSSHLYIMHAEDLEGITADLSGGFPL